jgi:hypothetical protein
VADKDKYGIPPTGGDGSIHHWMGITYAIPWTELLACCALAGWDSNTRAKAAAVAAAESSRQLCVYNTSGMGHFGLWQISRSAWPEFFKGSPPQDMAWVSPVAQAQQALKVYKKQGWKAWQAETSGAWFAYYANALAAEADLETLTMQHGQDEKGYWNSLISRRTQDVVLKAAGVDLNALAAGVATSTVGGAIADAANATAQGTVDSGAAVASSVGEMAQVVTGLWTALTNPSLWMRLGYGGLGVVLVAGGLFLIVRNQPAVTEDRQDRGRGPRGGRRGCCEGSMTWRCTRSLRTSSRPRNPTTRGARSTSAVCGPTEVRELPAVRAGYRTEQAVGNGGGGQAADVRAAPQGRRDHGPVAGHLHQQQSGGRTVRRGSAVRASPPWCPSW